VPAENLVGHEGMGFRHIIDGWNAERILIASEAIGDGRWFVERAAKYSANASSSAVRSVQSGRTVSYRARLCPCRSGDRMRNDAAEKFDRGEKCGEKPTWPKLLASEAAWEAANACLDAHGGYGFARDTTVERKFRETRLYITAPINNNLVLAFFGPERAGMPKSY